MRCNQRVRVPSSPSMRRVFLVAPLVVALGCNEDVPDNGAGFGSGADGGDPSMGAETDASPGTGGASGNDSNASNASAKIPARVAQTPIPSTRAHRAAPTTMGPSRHHRPARPVRPQPGTARPAATRTTSPSSSTRAAFRSTVRGSRSSTPRPAAPRRRPRGATPTPPGGARPSGQRRMPTGPRSGTSTKTSTSPTIRSACSLSSEARRSCNSCSGSKS